MTITQNIDELERIIRSTPLIPQLANRQSADQQPFPQQRHMPHQENILKELWQTLTAWERDFKYWSEEFQALKKIAALHMHGKKIAIKDSGHPFLRLEFLMEKTFPIHQKSLRTFRMKLRMLQTGEQAASEGSVDDLRKLNHNLVSFKEEVNHLKLGFFDIIYRKMPIAFL